MTSETTRPPSQRRNLCQLSYCFDLEELNQKPGLCLLGAGQQAATSEVYRLHLLQLRVDQLTYEATPMEFLPYHGQPGLHLLCFVRNLFSSPRGQQGSRAWHLIL